MVGEQGAKGGVVHQLGGAPGVEQRHLDSRVPPPDLDGAVNTGSAVGRLSRARQREPDLHAARRGSDQRIGRLAMSADAAAASAGGARRTYQQASARAPEPASRLPSCAGAIHVGGSVGSGRGQARRCPACRPRSRPAPRGPRGSPQVSQPDDERRKAGERHRRARSRRVPRTGILHPHGDQRAAHGPEKRSCPRQKRREQPSEDPEEEADPAHRLSRVRAPAPRRGGEGEPGEEGHAERGEVPARAREIRSEPRRRPRARRSHHRSPERGRRPTARPFALSGSPGSRRPSRGGTCPTIHQTGMVPPVAAAADLLQRLV